MHSKSLPIPFLLPMGNVYSETCVLWTHWGWSRRCALIIKISRYSRSVNLLYFFCYTIPPGTCKEAEACKAGSHSLHYIHKLNDLNKTSFGTITKCMNYAGIFIIKWYTVGNT